MRKIYLFLLLLWPLCLAAQVSVYSVGLRGGATAMFVRSDEVRSALGPSVSLDASYTLLYPVGQRTELGLRAGVGIGYAAASYRATLAERFSRQDYLMQSIDYTITASEVRERMQDIRLDVPLLLTLRTHGVVLAAGPRLVLPLWCNTRQDIRNLQIAACYPAYGVTVVNELITGQAADEQQHRQLKSGMYTVSVQAALEAGYEWRMADKRRSYGSRLVGLTAWAEVGVWSSIPGHEHTERLVDVAPIADPANPVPEVTVGTLSGILTRRPVPCSFGIRVYYGLEIPD